MSKSVLKKITFTLIFFAITLFFPLYGQISRGLLFCSYIKKTYTLILKNFYKKVNKEEIIKNGFLRMRKVISFSMPSNYSWEVFERYYLKLSGENPSLAGKLGEEALDGMVEGLHDPYSVLLTPKKLKLLKGGDGSSIGIELGAKKGKVIVVAPITGSPAEKAGFKSGDVILQVGNKSVKGKNLYYISMLIRGRAGDKLPITVLRGSRKITLYPVFSHFKVKPIRYFILPRGIGYVKITHFNGKVYPLFKYALSSMKRRKVKGLILDLRNNPGGDLEESLKIASLFVKKGVLVWVVKRGKASPIKPKGEEYVNMPLVILVNEGTASASEILSAAIQENKRGVLIGKTTFGKGIIQTEYRLTGGALLRLTTAAYRTPKKRDINGRGIVPNIVVQNAQPTVSVGKDPLVRKAWKILCKMIEDV